MAGEVLSLIEGDLGITVEGDFATAVNLVDPSGNLITTSANGGPLYGRYTADHERVTPDGQMIIVAEPCLVMRSSSLDRVPAAGETWGVTVWVRGVKTAFILDGQTRSPEPVESIGFVKLFPRKATQS